MSDESSARFALPYLQPGQAQKELYHNEALAMIDLVVQPAVLGVAVNTPPSAPVAGDCWIVGAAPTGAWAGNANRIAGWTEGGWRFIAPTPGMVAWSIPGGLEARYTGTGWSLGIERASAVMIGADQVIGARQPAIAAPIGGTTVDTQARATIAALLTALRTHGLIAP